PVLRAARRSTSPPSSLHLARPAAQQRVVKHRSRHLIQGRRANGHDPSTILAPVQRLGANDQPSAARLADGIDGREAGDQDDEPPVPARRFQHAGWNRRLLDPLIRQTPQGSFRQGRAAALASRAPLFATNDAHQLALAGSDSSI
ncbi:MAG TPA: hypothetical protein VH638_01960, partial [Gemmatimonadaceae bacterium]